MKAWSTRSKRRDRNLRGNRETKDKRSALYTLSTVNNIFHYKLFIYLFIYLLIYLFIYIQQKTKFASDVCDAGLFFLLESHYISEKRLIFGFEPVTNSSNKSSFQN